MRYLPLIFFLFIGCNSKKVTSEINELEKLKSEITYKLDSITIVLTKIEHVKSVKTDSTDFEISFAPNEVGEIDLLTPNGRYTATKKGNGNVTLKGNARSLKSTQNTSTIEKTSQQTKEAKEQRTTRQSETQTKEVKPNLMSLILSYVPWWSYLILILMVLFLIFWKALKTYLKTLPIIGRFIK